MTAPLDAATLARLEALGQTTRSPSVRLLCGEVRRLQAALSRAQQAHATDAQVWTEERERLRAEVERLRAALAGVVAQVDGMVARHCTHQARARFCEEYGCSTLLELVAPLRAALETGEASA